MPITLNGDGAISGLTATGISAVQTIPSATITQAMLQTAVVPLGVGQTWQNVLGSRSFSVTYTNSTGRPILVYCGAAQSGAAFISESPNGFTGSMAPAVGSPTISILVLVPAGQTYNLSNQGVVFSPSVWLELR
jgi:hypothetical protein